ncbi:hypothetical protein SARC_14233, partial [Sphaeroforma arctica JP610]
MHIHRDTHIHSQTHPHTLTDTPTYTHRHTHKHSQTTIKQTHAHTGALTYIAHTQMGALEVLQTIASTSAVGRLSMLGPDNRNNLSACEQLMLQSSSPAALRVACARVLVNAATNAFNTGDEHNNAAVKRMGSVESILRQLLLAQ